jgi:polyhydroxybutyrate depolymerase
LLGAWACEHRPSPSKPAINPQATASTPPAPAAIATSAAKLATGAAPARTEALDAAVHLPPNLAPGQRVPLLLMLHALGTSAEDIGRTDWSSFAEKNGVAWLAPNGPVDAQGRRFWDAGPSCCNFGGAPIDHVAALRVLLAETLERYPIDRERVFVGGISNGGFMAHRLACAAPELMRGIVSISGAGPLEAASCRDPKSLRVLEIHGDSDPIVAYDGGHLFQDPKLPEHASAQKTAADWAARLGCRGDPVAGEALNLETRYPGNETRVARYEACARGALELWTVTGGNHYLAFYNPAPEVIWQFLNR